MNSFELCNHEMKASAWCCGKCRRLRASEYLADMCCQDSVCENESPSAKIVRKTLSAIANDADYVSIPCFECSRVRLMPYRVVDTEHTYRLECEKCGWTVSFVAPTVHRSTGNGSVRLDFDHPAWSAMVGVVQGERGKGPEE